MSKLAIVIGVGPGLGWELSKRFARGGLHVAMVARDDKKLDQLAAQESDLSLSAHSCNAADAREVGELFASLEKHYGAPAVVVYNAGAFAPGSILDIEPADFERCWQVGCLGGFLVSREAARRMLSEGEGSIIFTGATASLRGGAKFANLAVPKFGLRALAQCLARELGPENIHVAHVIIDGQIRSEKTEELLEERGPDALLEPAAIAEQYWQLHQQDRSAWTQELDLRPWVEKF